MNRQTMLRRRDPAQAARDAIAADRLMDGEQPASMILEDAQHWRLAYSELIVFKRILLAAMEDRLAMSESMARTYRRLIVSTGVLIRRAEARGVHWNRSSERKSEYSRVASGAIKSDWTSGGANLRDRAVRVCKPVTPHRSGTARGGPGSAEVHLRSPRTGAVRHRLRPGEQQVELVDQAVRHEGDVERPIAVLDDVAGRPPLELRDKARHVSIDEPGVPLKLARELEATNAPEEGLPLR